MSSGQAKADYALDCSLAIPSEQCMDKTFHWYYGNEPFKAWTDYALETSTWKVIGDIIEAR